MSKQPPPAPSARAIGPCPTIIQTSRTPRNNLPPLIASDRSSAKIFLRLFLKSYCIILNYFMAYRVYLSDYLPLDIGTTAAYLSTGAMVISSVGSKVIFKR